MRLASDLDPAHCPVSVDHTALERVRDGMLRMGGSSDRRLHAGAILRVEHAQPFVQREFLLRRAEDRLEAVVALDLIGQQVQVPPAHLRRVERQPPLLGDLHQSGICPFAFDELGHALGDGGQVFQ